MPGGIIGVYGAQRSGKTLISYKIAQYIYNEVFARTGTKIPIYTNLFVKPNNDIEMINVNAIRSIPLTLSPKIILLDEIYNGTDANDYRSLKDISIFINTLGKQNALLIYTSIDDSMVYNRIRNQCNLNVLVKKSGNDIFYRTFDPATLVVKDYCVHKGPALFEGVHYDTNFIPLTFNWDMTEWQQSLKEFYKENYGICLDDVVF